MSLARRYRPRKFSELVGQELTVRALLQTLKQKSPPQAFLFSGIRGTGKTSVARLYAAALNCQSPEGFEACSGCPSCDAFARGCHDDILEIDGASHNGVEDVRRLQETVLYLPQRFSRKVYLIDEVHMLSIAAFNALLKTLEEPPPHVVFLFATTELSKLPATVVGRCQTFHLRRIPQNLILQRLKRILQSEGISCEDEALELLAQQGEGSLRDVLSLLDQAIALGGHEEKQAHKISRSGVEMLLDYVPWSTFLPLFEDVLQRRRASMLMRLASLIEQGHEPILILQKLILTARHGWVVKSLPPDAPELVKLGLSSADSAALRRAVVSCSIRDLHLIFRSLSAALGDLQGCGVDRYILENILMEWCLESSASTLQPSSQVSVLQEEGTSQAGAATFLSRASLPSSAALSASAAPAARGAPPPSAAPMQRSSFPTTWEELVQRWKQHQPLQATELSCARVQHFSSQGITLVVDGEAAQRLCESTRVQSLQHSLRQHFSFHGVLKVLPAADLASSQRCLEGQALTYDDLPLSLQEEEQQQRQHNHNRFRDSVEKSALHRAVVQHFPHAQLSVEQG